MNFMEYLDSLRASEFISITSATQLPELAEKLRAFGQFEQARIAMDWYAGLNKCATDELTCRPFDEEVDALAPYNINHYSEYEEDGWTHAESVEEFYRIINLKGQFYIEDF